MKKENLFIWFSGAVVGLLAVILVLFGNPLNMGFCIACFERDIAGALGLHRAAVVQYIRPEILGIVLGAFIAGYASKEFRPEGGSSTITRFFLGILVMVGALVFLGCPLRMMIRLGGGDLNALVALLGFIAGIAVGVYFLKSGFDLGRAREQKTFSGWVLPIVMIGLLLLVIVAPMFNAEAGGPIFFSAEGPGAQHAAIALALVAGLLVGYLAQRSRLCLAGGTRDWLLIKDSYLLKGFIAILAIVFLGNILVGVLGVTGTNTPAFNLGFEGQPIAHAEHLWNFLGMALVGLGSVLLGGCPLRQLVLAGNGNTDSAVAVLGMIIGAAISHNFMLAASPKGVPDFAKYAVIGGLIICLAVGFLNKEKA
ncbi:MAG TPA: YedE-related selenium metabolism membrane protein [Actinobacteria bacterium]|nr:YedE-related selenium metabolism membrane protein [Actinomycetota bacterium]